MIQQASNFGVDANSWWDGFLGAVVSGLVAVAVAIIAARSQTRGVRRQIERDRLSRAAEGLMQQLPALADRTRTYSKERYEEARDHYKDANLASDAQREINLRLLAYTGRPIRSSISETVTVFAQYARRFEQSRMLETEKAKEWLEPISIAITTYVREIVELIGEDLLADGRGVTRQVLPPIF